VMVITQFGAEDPEATMHAMADEILKFASDAARRQMTRVISLRRNFSAGSVLTADSLGPKLSTIAKLNSKGAAAMSDDLDLNLRIGYQVQSTAEWRREKALQFPDDTRNLRAAEELERLAVEIEALEGSDIHRQISDVHDSIFRLCDEDDNVTSIDSVVWDLNEAVSAELRSIGFHGGYETGTQFLEWYRDLLREKFETLLGEAVPAPDLDEQVANDPAVKAAKDAYDAAYAKAFAEARKKL